MDNDLTPARIVTPGEILQIELDARNWTQKEFAAIVDRPPQMINEIIKGKKQITPDTAIQFSQALGSSAKFWMNLEMNYQLDLAKKQQENTDIKRRSRINSIFPVKEAVKRGWIKSVKSLDELEKIVCSFLEISSLSETPEMEVHFCHSTSFTTLESSRIAWCKRAQQITDVRKFGDFKLENFKQAIPSILECSQKDEDIQNIPNILNEVGVHFIVLPHLPKTCLDGAAINTKDNPIIALTTRYDRIDNFWFTLMHEIGHIYAGHKGIFLDDINKVEDNAREAEANKLSSDWLININAYDNFIANQKGKFSKASVREFALDQGRHPGIIVGRLHHEKKIPFTHQNKSLVKVKHLLNDWVYK